MTHWHVLAAVGAINWSGYFIYDIPASLSNSLSEHLSLPDHQFAYLISLLYTVYAVPNTILPFFSSAAVRRFGERTVLLLTVSSIILGQLLFSLAIQTRSQLGLIVGRVCIGLGGEVVGVLGVEVITRSFQDRSLSLALATNLGAGRLGSVANTVIVPHMIGPYGITSATWTATALAVGFAVIGLISLLMITRPRCQVDDEDPLRAATVEGKIKITPAGTVPSSNVGQFPTVFWYLAMICLLGYGCLNTFTNSAPRFLATRFYDGDQRAAGSATSILFILSGILVPPFGILLDRLSSKNYPRALITANVFLALAHALFLTHAVSSPIVPLCFLGTADAIIGVSFWASVVKCLRPETVTLIEGETTREHEPLLKNEAEDNYNKLGSETLISVSSSETLTEYSPDLASDNDLEDSTASTLDTDADTHREPAITSDKNNTTTTLGLGIMTSLMNISTAAVPFPAAVMEGFAGFQGLEGMFFVLALLSCIIGWFGSGSG
ncbi:major facilitator superfamily domain-containing protein [Aspergillus undulatus]|uniref:major facilitator superfamily domain-containing protein n=1 Tax=Aspergillus undulatus TaxID=1810928 RepID=UPI003CCE4A1F